MFWRKFEQRRTQSSLVLSCEQQRERQRVPLPGNGHQRGSEMEREREREREVYGQSNRWLKVGKYNASSGWHVAQHWRRVLYPHSPFGLVREREDWDEGRVRRHDRDQRHWEFSLRENSQLVSYPFKRLLSTNAGDFFIIMAINNNMPLRRFTNYIT